MALLALPSSLSFSPRTFLPYLYKRALLLKLAQALTHVTAQSHDTHRTTAEYLAPCLLAADVGPSAFLPLLLPLTIPICQTVPLWASRRRVHSATRGIAERENIDGVDSVLSMVAWLTKVWSPCGRLVACLHGSLLLPVDASCGLGRRAAPPPGRKSKADGLILSKNAALEAVRTRHTARWARPAAGTCTDSCRRMSKDRGRPR